MKNQPLISEYPRSINKHLALAKQLPKISIKFLRKSAKSAKSAGKYIYILAGASLTTGFEYPNCVLMPMC